MLPKNGMTMAELLALPVSFGLPVAARALGIGRNKAYEMREAGEFPVPVHRIRGQYTVTRPDLFWYLGMTPEGAHARTTAA